MQRWVRVGSVGRPFGVRGWFRIHSDTEPAAQIRSYAPWAISHDADNLKPCSGLRTAGTNTDLRAHLAGLDSPEAVQSLRGAGLYVPRSALPVSADGAFYWTDLEGLRVRNTDGVDFGVVKRLFSTGANDVVVVHGDRERLIPWDRPRVVTDVDLSTGWMVVDWDPED